MATNSAPYIYAEQLISCGFGLPLWQPEPTSFGEVLIGDVGFVQDGCFYRLFNAMRPETDPANARGVPEGFVRLNVDESELVHTTEDFLPPGPVYSTQSLQCKVEAGVSLHAGPASSAASYTFSCNGNQGAMAVLGDFGTEARVLRNFAFSRYMKAYHSSWCAFAYGKGYALHPSDLVLVYGWLKTSEWALAAFTNQGRTHEISFSAEAGAFAAARFGVTYGTDVHVSMQTRAGPRRPPDQQGQEASSTLPKNQCMFLKYYKQKTRLLRSPKITWEADAKDARGSSEYENAESSHFPPSSATESGQASRLFRGSGGRATQDSSNNGSSEGEKMDWDSSSSGGSDVEQIPNVGKFPDPLDHLLEHIFQHSSVDVAIVNHDDLYTICEPADRWPNDVQSLLQYLSPKLYIDPEGGFGLLDQTSLKERGPLQPSNRRAQAAEGPPDPMDIESHSKPTMTSSSGSTNVGQVYVACGPCRRMKVKCEPSESTSGACNRCLRIGSRQLCLIVPPKSDLPRKTSGPDVLLRQIQQQAEQIKELMRILDETRTSSRELLRPKSPAPSVASSSLYTDIPSIFDSTSAFAESDSEREDDELRQSSDSRREDWIRAARSSIQAVDRYVEIQSADLQQNTAESRQYPGEMESDGEAPSRPLQQAPSAGISPTGSGPQILECGLITVAEAGALIKIFWTYIHPCIGLLDPEIYTMPYMSTHSPLLFTTVCAIASRFYTNRPNLYGQAMQCAIAEASHAFASGSKAIGVVHSYVLLVLYPQARKKWADDQTWVYLGLATLMATELGLGEQLPRESKSEIEGRVMLTRTRAWFHCLSLDGLIGSLYGKRPAMKATQDATRADAWWNSSTHNMPELDLHLTAHMAACAIVDRVWERVYCDPNSPTGLDKGIDAIKLAIEADDQLTQELKTWISRFEEAVPSTQHHAFQRGLMCLTYNYLRILVLSFAFREGSAGSSSVQDRLLSRCRRAASDVLDTYVLNVANDQHCKMLRHAPDMYTSFVTFACTFLIDLLKSRHSAHISRDECAEIKLQLYQVAELMGSDKVALDRHHTPGADSYFLQQLLAKLDREGISPFVV